MVGYCFAGVIGWDGGMKQEKEDETYLLFVCTMVASSYLLRNLCVPIDDTFTQRAAYVTVLLFVRTMMVVIMDHLRAFTSVRCST